MTSSYIHRSMPCSVIIRQASFCNRWEYTSGQYAESERLRTVGLTWDVSIKSLHLQLRKPCGRGSRKSRIAREDEEDQGTKAF